MAWLDMNGDIGIGQGILDLFFKLFGDTVRLVDSKVLAHGEMKIDNLAGA